MSTVVIVGAESGIGLAAVIEMKEQGHDVWVTAKDEGGEGILRAYLSEDRILRLDLSVREDVRRVADELVRIGHIDALICNAGVAMGGPVSHLDMNALRYLYEVNVFGHLALFQILLPSLLRASDPRFIWIGSAAGYFVRPLLGGYASSKFAVTALTEALRVELKGRVKVSLIAPGRIKTPIWEKGEEDAKRLLAQEGLETYSTAIAKLRAEAKTNRVESPNTDIVVRAIAHAMGAADPRPVYRVGRDAKLAFWLKWILPVRWLDALLRKLCW